MKWLRRQILVWSVLLLSTGSAFAQVSKIAPDLKNVAKLLSLGGIVNQTYSVIPAIAVKLPAIAITLLELDPSVAYISPDRVLAGTLDLTTAAVNANVA